MELDVRRLRMVHAIAEAGSVTRAATRLGMSQPALTRQLQRIEASLDGCLFMRLRDGVRPTALGELVVGRARTVLMTIDSLSREIARVGPSAERLTTVRLGSIPGPLLSGLVKGLRTLLPDAEVRSITRQSPEFLVELLVAGRLEIVALGEVHGFESEHRPDLEWHVVAEEPLCAMVPVGHKLASLPEVSLPSMARMPWVLPPPGDDNIREAFLRACSDAGFTPHIRHEAAARSVRDLVASGEGVGIAQATTYDPMVARIPISGSPVRIRHLILYARTGPMTRYREELRRLATAAYAQAASTNPRFAQWLAAHVRTELTTRTS